MPKSVRHRPMLGPFCLLLGVLSLGTGPARAQQAPAASPASTDAALCALPDELLQVSVGGQNRGDRVVRVAPDGILLEQAALQAGEARYGSRTVSCDGEAYVLLTPQVKPVYDQAAQTLTLTPVLDLLPGNTLDFRGAVALTPSPTQAVYGLDGGLLLQGDTTGTLNTQGYLGAAYFGGALSGYAGVSGSAALSGGQLKGGFGVRALLHYDLNTDWGVTAAYRAEGDTVGGLGYTLGSFSGLSVRVRGGLQRELERVQLDLPLEANVVVRVGERTLKQFRAAPGRLVLTHIPLENVVGTVEVRVTDSTGTRSFSAPYSFSGGTLPLGGYLATVRAGVTGDPLGGSAQRSAAADARVGLGGDWSLSGSARLTGDDYGAAVQARHSTATDSLGLGLNVDGALGAAATGTAARPALRLSADYARQLGPLNLSALVSVPLASVQASQLGAALGYQGGRWSSGVSAGYDLGTRQLNAGLSAGYTLDDHRQLSASVSAGYSLADQTWNAGLSASYAPNAAGVLSASVSSSPGRVRAALSYRFTPDSRLAVEAGGALGQGVTGTSLAGTLAATYQPSPNQTLRAATDLNTLNVGYDDTRQVDASAGVSISRAGGTLVASGRAEVQGAVTVLGGHAVLGRALGQRAVLVRTGTPGIPLLLGGSRVAVTDARGEAILSGLPDGRASQVAVDLDALPFNITAQDASADVSLAGSGVYVLDWSHNFDVSRWVQLFWSTAEHSVYGVLHLNGETYTLDDAGNVLIPAAATTQRGTLSSDDGTRSCELDLTPHDDRAVCLPAPVMNDLGTAEKGR